MEGGSLAARDDEPLEAVAQRLGHHFARPELLELALTHGSRSVEGASQSNERQADEGLLSEARARAVNSDALAGRTRALSLERAVRLGRGEQKSGGRDKPSIQANVFEAVLGAIYLDGGLEAARALVVREFGEALRAPPEAARDPKSRLQELLQQQGTLPSYALVSSSDSPQDPRFEVEVRVDDRAIGRGEGRSKRAAERAAALRALEELAE
ncbi:MAG: ribonuclease III [Deltaproteobacteria bacterium]|nr:ribonuclease III [Deltaproteobacteria bacterium]